MTEPLTDWQTSNLQAIQQRLAWLWEQPDGLLFCELSGVHFVVVRKDSSRIRVALVERIDLQTDLVQSSFDLKNPVTLELPYTQAMLLGLVWQRTPKKIYIAGLGGGRIPQFLYHYLPQTTIDCTEIDPTVLRVAEKFFGVQLDERFQVTIQEGREYLKQKTEPGHYDLMLIDVFLGNGYTPYHLVTKEFYELCNQHLSPEGLVTINLLQRDQFYAAKLKTIQSVFPQVYLFSWKGVNSIVIGSRGVLIQKSEIFERMKSLQNAYPFSVSFEEFEVFLSEDLRESVPNLAQAQVLCDESPPAGYFNCWLF